MLSSSEWLYCGGRDVWSSGFNLTVPPAVFDEYDILPRDGLGWWGFDTDIAAVFITNKGDLDESAAKILTYAQLNQAKKSDASGGGTRYFTIPQRFTTESDETVVPPERQLATDTTVHFISDQDAATGDVRLVYLLTEHQVEEILPHEKVWADESGTISRLVKSELSEYADIRTGAGGEGTVWGGDSTDSSQSADSDETSASSADQAGTEDSMTMADSVTEQWLRLEIEDVPPEIVSLTDMHYLLVRYGVNEYLEQNPAEIEKEVMWARNEEIDVDTNYDEESEILETKVPLRIHERLPTEFKLFVTVRDPDRLTDVRDAFQASPSCSSASISDSLHDRVYMLLERFRTTESPEGFVNNVVYPK